MAISRHIGKKAKALPEFAQSAPRQSFLVGWDGMPVPLYQKGEDLPMGCYVLRSPRLGFQAACPAWAQAAGAFYRRNRTAFASVEPRHPEEFFTTEGQRERLAWEQAQAEAGRSFRFLLIQPRHPGKVVGMAGLNEIVGGAFQSCFLSYKVDHTLWGCGLAPEAISYLVEWAFRTLGLHRVEANIMPRNTASLRAAEKAGFVREGLSRQYLRINGVWEDHLHLVRLNSRWEDPAARSC